MTMTCMTMSMNRLELSMNRLELSMNRLELSMNRLESHVQLLPISVHFNSKICVTSTVLRCYSNYLANCNSHHGECWDNYDTD